MKPFLQFLFFALFTILLSGCSNQKNSLEEFNKVIYKPVYASGFEVVGSDNSQSTILKVSNPWQGAENVETMLFISRNGETPPGGFAGEVLKGSANKIICMSSTHIAMLEMLNEVKRVVGVSGIDYISNPYISSNQANIGDIGYDGNVNYELLVSLDPDLVLLFGVNGASGMEPKLKELNIPFVYIGEYLEESPLGKAEWLVAISEIINQGLLGEELFSSIPKRYQALQEKVKNITSERPKVMINTPYGDTWFMASSGSYVAQLISDAGGEYIYKKNSSNKSLPIDMEEAYLLASQADIWLNVGAATSLKELKSMNPKFADTRCVQNGTVYNSTKRMNVSGGNDYWESGVVNPDIVLRDLIKIFYPDLITEDFYYYRQLP